LVTILVFASVAITVTSGAIIVAAINTQGISKASRSEIILQNINSAGELSALEILRNPDYSGENLTIQNTDITISVTGSTTKTTDVYNTSGDFIRKLRIIGDYANNEYNITSREEIP
jgi:hypothetical protein